MEQDEVLKNELDELLEGLLPTTKEELKDDLQDDVKVEEVKDGKEGEERKEEDPSEQKSDLPTDVKEEKEVVTEQVEEKEEEKVPEQTSELEELKKANEELRQQMILMSDKMFGAKSPTEKTPEQIEAEKAEQEKASKQVLGFIQNEEVFDEVFKSHHNFNALLTAVVNTSVEKVLRMAPQMVTNMIDQQVTLKSAAQEFYRKNDDLLQHKSFVGFVANEVGAQHADWPLDKILEETEREVRNRLRLHKQNTQGAGESQEKGRIREVKNPGFVPGGGAGRRGEVQASLKGIDKDIMDLIS